MSTDVQRPQSSSDEQGSPGFLSTSANTEALLWLANPSHNHQYRRTSTGSGHDYDFIMVNDDQTRRPLTESGNRSEAVSYATSVSSGVVVPRHQSPHEEFSEYEEPVPVNVGPTRLDRDLYVSNESDDAMATGC